MHADPITDLIHENFWIVLSFAYGRPMIASVIDARFEGECKYLRKTISQDAESRADRALLEMATQLRVLDDREGLSEIMRQRGAPKLGRVIQADDAVTDLYLRDFTNKAMHARRYDWVFDDRENPQVIFLPHEEKRWKRAEANMIDLMHFIGQLMH